MVSMGSLVHYEHGKKILIAKPIFPSGLMNTLMLKLLILKGPLNTHYFRKTSIIYGHDLKRAGESDAIAS